MKETIICLICGGEFKQLSGHLKKKHGIDGKEYRKMFPNAPLMSELLIYNRTGKNNGMYGHTHNDKSKEKCGSGARGRVQTETEKNQRTKSNKEWHEDSDNKIKFQIAIDELFSNQEFIDYRTEKLQEALNRKNAVKNFFNYVDLTIDIFNGNVVKCEICGFWGEHLVSHISDYHNMEISDYKKIYPDSKLNSDIYSIKLSCGAQGIDICDFDGFISDNPYCEKFNEIKRKEIRDKYNNRDYLTGIHRDIINKDKNGKIQELSVHHFDYNKQQGCSGHKWKLIPVSRRHNTMFNYNRSFWKRLIEYSLDYDKDYYNENKIFDIFRGEC